MKNNVGIYKITNMINGKIYIGQSKSLNKRKSDHFRALERGRHQNIHLQYAVNKYGLGNFNFEVIERIEVEELTNRENYWMEFYKSYNREKGYNIHRPSDNRSGYEASEETKERISKSKIEYTDEYLLSILVDFYNENGRVFTHKEVGSENGYPSYGIYHYRFGSFKKALELAGILDNVKNRYAFERNKITKEVVIDSYLNFIKKHGRFPNHKEMNSSSISGVANLKHVQRYFISIDNFKKELGWNDDDVLEKEKEDALNALKLLYEKEGKVTHDLISKSNITRSTYYYSKHFGSIKNALILAEIEYVSEIENKKNYSKSKYNKNDAINKIESFMEKYGRFPVKKDFRNAGDNDIPSRDVINRIFGSVDNLKKELGILTLEEKTEVDKLQALEDIKIIYDEFGCLNFKLIDEKAKRSVNYYVANFGNIKEIHKVLEVPYKRSYLRSN